MLAHLLDGVGLAAAERHEPRDGEGLAAVGGGRGGRDLFAVHDQRDEARGVADFLLEGGPDLGGGEDRGLRGAVDGGGVG